MIEIFGVSLAYETIAWVAAFVASEVIGASKLKENGVASLVKTFIDRAAPTRKEDEKVAEVKKAAELLRETLRQIGD